MTHQTIANQETRTSPVTVNNLHTLSIVTTTDPHAQNIWHFLAQLNTWAASYQAKLPVILVDDLKLWPSPPAADVFQHFQQLNIRVIWYPEHRGQLPAMQAGMAQVQTPLLMTFDPDMSQAITLIPDMLVLAQSGHPLVHLARTQRVLSPLRRLGSRLTNSLNKLATGLAIPDINSPVILLQRQYLATLQNIPNTQIQPRLFLYWQLRQQIAVIYWAMDNTNNAPSSYSTLSLIRLFANFFRQSLRMWRYRKSVE